MPKSLKDNPNVQWFQASFKSIKRSESHFAKGLHEDEEIQGTVIRGLASTPTKDRGNDIVDPKAFTKSIRKNYKNNPIILFSHNPDRPIGKATFLAVTEKGLEIEALIVDADIEPKIQAGILKAFSIGYIPKKVEFEDGDGNKLDPNKSEDREKIWFDPKTVRRITELDLVENSIVSTPMNPDALFSLQKSVKSFFDNGLSETQEDADLEFRKNGVQSNLKKPFISLIDNIMPKPKNLLDPEVKEEGAKPAEPAAEVPKEEEPAKPAEEAAPAEPAKPTKPADGGEKPAEEPEPTADEKNGDGEGVEKPAEGEEAGEDPKPKADPESAPEKPEGEEGPADEKSVKAFVDTAVKTIKKLVGQVEELQKELSVTPIKQAAVVTGNPKMHSDVSGGPATPVPAEPGKGAKTGFKAALLDHVN